MTKVFAMEFEQKFRWSSRESHQRCPVALMVMTTNKLKQRQNESSGLTFEGVITQRHNLK